MTDTNTEREPQLAAELRATLIANGLWATDVKGEHTIQQIVNIFVRHEAKHQQLQSIPMVNGLDCPACGHPTLILGNGGYITCSLEDCPNPDYAKAVIAEAGEDWEEGEESGCTCLCHSAAVRQNNKDNCNYCVTTHCGLRITDWNKK